MLESYTNLTLVAYGEISSSALNLFLTTKCYKRVTDCTMGCVHLPYFIDAQVNLDLTIRSSVKKSVYTYMPRSVKETLKIIAPIIGEKKIKKIKQFQDVWLKHKELKKIVKKLK